MIKLSHIWFVRGLSTLLLYQRDSEYTELVLLSLNLWKYACAGTQTGACVNAQTNKRLHLCAGLSAQVVLDVKMPGYREHRPSIYTQKGLFHSN